jgi:protoheme IX farnesyltransferase
MKRIKLYYRLAKPGIIYGNLLAAIAGYLLAAAGEIDGWRLVGFAIGISLVMASACVLNNILDRGIDEKMARTKKRALVTGDITTTNALIYATILGLVGFYLLVIYTNWLCAILGLLALFLYVVVYGIAKRKSVHGTLIGAIPGAIPPVAGYVGVTNQLDLGAWLLFIVMVAWQMPHFYAIAIYRKKEYAAASLPIMSVKYGNETTKRHMLSYIILFIIASLSLTYFGYTDIIFAAAMLIAGMVWLRKMRKGFRAEDSEKWARGMFFLSLKILLLFCLLLSVEAWLP